MLALMEVTEVPCKSSREAELLPCSGVLPPCPERWEGGGVVQRR